VIFSFMVNPPRQRRLSLARPFKAGKGVQDVEASRQRRPN
jgi:hypothetical protein